MDTTMNTTLTGKFGAVTYTYTFKRRGDTTLVTEMIGGLTAAQATVPEEVGRHRMDALTGAGFTLTTNNTIN